jgi:hypothetical protein
MIFLLFAPPVFLETEIAGQLGPVWVCTVQDSTITISVDGATGIEGEHDFQTVRLAAAAGVQLPGLALPKPCILTVVKPAGNAVTVEKLDHNKNFRECGHIIFLVERQV